MSVLRASPIVAPASTYISSENDDADPAPASTTTSYPSLIRWATVVGVAATRVSPGRASRRTPMIITSPEGSPTRQAEPSAAPRAQSGRACAHDKHGDLDVSAVRDGIDHDGPPESVPSRFGPPPPRGGLRTHRG